MTQLMHPSVSPMPEAYGAQPLDAVEIDTHVDGPRIWATILAVRDELERYEAVADEKVADAQQGERDARAARAALETGDEDERHIDVDEAQNAFDAFVTGGYKKKDLDALKVALWKDT